MREEMANLWRSHLMKKGGVIQDMNKQFEMLRFFMQETLNLWSEIEKH